MAEEISIRHLKRQKVTMRIRTNLSVQTKIQAERLR